MDNNEIRKQMELDQKRAFCKQSCTKIDQGLDRLDPRSGERAIWELFQNARDLARIDQNHPDSDGIHFCTPRATVRSRFSYIIGNAGVFSWKRK